jgi:FlgD Ig-like domain
LQRVLTTVTLLGLLVATAAAFAITEHLKLIKSPVYGPIVSKFVSPVCRCSSDTAKIRIRLRHPDRVTVTILDSDRNTVATVASGVGKPAKHPDHFVWDGLTDAGTVAPDGIYRPEVYLANARRTILLPNRIILDTRVPQVLSASGAKAVLLVGSGQSVAIRYTFNEQAHAAVYLNNRLIILGRRTRAHSKVKWAGTLGGRPLRAGTYVLSVGARDVAGNETPAAERKQVTVTVRYVVLTPARLTVRSGALFTVHVETAAKRYTWRLGKRHGSHRGKRLRLRAPTTPTRYRLVVSEGGQSTTAVVRVRAK